MREKLIRVISIIISVLTVAAANASHISTYASSSDIQNQAEYVDAKPSMESASTLSYNKSDIAISYAGRDASGIWSTSYTDNTKYYATGYMTGLIAQITSQPSSMTGTIRYSVNISGYGWSDWYENGALATSDSLMHIESIKVELNGQLADHFDIYTKIYQDENWSSWVKNGESAGQEGIGKRVDGVRIAVTVKDAGEPGEPKISMGNFNPSKPMVALTFDDGPSSEYTNRILTALEKVGGRATFFIVGSRVSGANVDCIKRMVLDRCELGNHTYNHGKLRTMSASEQLETISSTNEIIKQVSGGYAPTVMRPTYGSYNDDTLAVLTKLDMPAILWSIDTLDWKTKNPANTEQVALSQVKDGSIILMHDIYGTTADAAEKIIPELVARGYQLVTVSELASTRGGIKAGGHYGSFYK